MSPTLRVCLPMLVAAVVGGGAWAADLPLAGVVKRVSGEVQVVRGAAAQPALVGQGLQVGDVIRTGPNGSASVTLSDDTLISAGPKSEVVITDYSFNSTTHDGGLLLSLWRGTVSMVTGLLARKAPEKVNVQTRTVVLGVRGTEFVVDAGDGR